jgi:hypothetical protein
VNVLEEVREGIQMSVRLVHRSVASIGMSRLQIDQRAQERAAGASEAVDADTCCYRGSPGPVGV